jgi:hypothetical protein
MHRFPQIGSLLHIQPEVRAVAEHPGENERGPGGHVAPVVAELVDVLALDAHGIGKRTLSQAHRLHEFLDQDSPTEAGLRFVISMVSPVTVIVEIEVAQVV